MACGRSPASSSPPTFALKATKVMMSGLVRLDVATGPREEPRSALPLHAALPSQLQSMKRLLGLATSLPPTQMQFFDVEGEPMLFWPPAPVLPAETVTTKLGLLKRAV